MRVRCKEEERDMRSPTPPPTTPSDSSLKNLIFILYFMPVFPGCKICSLALSLELQVFFLRKQTKRKKKTEQKKKHAVWWALAFIQHYVWHPPVTCPHWASKGQTLPAVPQRMALYQRKREKQYLHYKLYETYSTVCIQFFLLEEKATENHHL